MTHSYVELPIVNSVTITPYDVASLSQQIEHQLHTFISKVIDETIRQNGYF